MFRNQTPPTIRGSSTPASAPRSFQGKVPSRAASEDPFINRVPSGRREPLRSLAGPTSYTEFVLDCVERSKTYTTHVGFGVHQRNQGLMPEDINPSDPLHSLGSPEPLPRASRRLRSAATSRLPSSRSKRAAAPIVSHPEDDTDSEIELFPHKRHKSAKRQKVSHSRNNEHDAHDGHLSTSPSPDSDTPSIQQHAHVQPAIKRAQRIIDPSDPADAALIAATPRTGADYYDSDADDLPGPIKGMKDTANHFRNVTWGRYATDKSNDADFPTTPSFRAFVPGRYERLADGTAFDQKRKLIVKLTDMKGIKHIFANPPPRDWTNQDAITALNKKTVQQIRRNTAVKFRERVSEYVEVERAWMLAHLTDGKPRHGWARFVREFNERFAGQVVQGCAGARPARTQSSLSKEVSGRKEFYGKGVVPVLSKAAKK